MRRYNPQEIEPKWQQVWRETNLYKTDMSRGDDKFYVIPMLPYPSGDLHVGHWYNFGPTDTVARFRRMLGQNVLQTIGFDAFGLPAENAAIKRGIQPAKWTRENITSMTKQIEQIGASYDWSHSLATCDPDYYRWNQWLFLQLYKHKLAYRAKAVVNWCPKDQTVLANEQVVGENNVCERCGTPVIQKEMESWYFKITDYTERLLADLDQVDWPQKVKTMQVNWIGQSRGALVDFETENKQHKIKVFTTRPDTIFGATYMVLAPEHPLVSKVTSAECRERVEAYIEETSHKTELERKTEEKVKSGTFTGAYAINPATKEKIPIWIADYVLMGYGTGAIMAVPAHDERDFEFAQKFDLPITQVIMPCEDDSINPPRNNFEEVERPTVIVHLKDKSTGKFALLDWHESLEGITTAIMGGIEIGQTPEEAALAEIKEEAALDDVTITKKLRWTTAARYCASHKQQNRKAISQAFMAEVEDLKNQSDIPKPEQKLHTLVWVDEAEVLKRLTPDHQKLVWEQLKAEKPLTGEGELINSGKYDGMNSAEARDKIVADLANQNVAKEQTNYRLRDWLISRQRYWGTPIPIVYCNDCGTVPVPEDDLPVILPEDVEFELSGQSPLVHREDFVNTTCPKCGRPAKRETDTMDTFVCSSWYFLRYLDNKNEKAPFDTDIINKWAPVDHYIGGVEHAILHLLYARFVTKFLHDNYGLNFEEPFKKLTNQGIILGPDGHKMSKSRGNVVSPDEQVNSYGADSLRLYLMFMGPYDQGGPYNLGGITGMRRFLERVWLLVGEIAEAKAVGEAQIEEIELTAATHRAIKKVTKDLEQLGFNTAIAAMMAFTNELYKFKGDKVVWDSAGWRFALETLVQLLAPFVPHIAEEMWQELGHKTSVHISNWPLWDEELVKDETITLAVQVNGKLRSEIMVPADIDEESAIEAAKSDAKTNEYLMDKTIKKAIYVPGRLVSLVVD